MLRPRSIPLQISSKEAWINERNLPHPQKIRTSVIQPRYRHNTDVPNLAFAPRRSEINAARAQFTCDQARNFLTIGVRKT